MKIKETILISIIGIILVHGASCSFQKGKEVGESAVDKFHQQYHQIYGQTDHGFKKVTTEDQLTELLKAVHRKLGTVKEAKQMAWHVNSTTSGTQVYLAYQTSFVEGDGSSDQPPS